MVLKQNLFILGSEGVIGSKITSYFENEYNIFKYDYSLGHDFTNEQKQMYDNGFSRGLKKGVFSTTWSNYPEVYYFCIGCLTLVILGSIII